MASSQSGMHQEAHTRGAVLSNETQVASSRDFQPRDYPHGSANRGHAVYNKNCISYHGTLAKGEYGPTLQQNGILQANDRFWTTVLKGRGHMPAFEERLSSQQIADIQAFLKSLRPAAPP